MNQAPQHDVDRSQADTPEESGVDAQTSSDLTLALGSTSPVRKSLWSVLGEAKQTLQDSTAGVIQGASGAIGSVTDQAGKTIGGAIDGTGKTLGGIVEGTTKVVSNTQKAVGETFIATTQTVGTAIETAQKQVGETMKGTGQIRCHQL